MQKENLRNLYGAFLNLQSFKRPRPILGDRPTTQNLQKHSKTFLKPSRRAPDHKWLHAGPIWDNTIKDEKLAEGLTTIPTLVITIAIVLLCLIVSCSRDSRP